jgi:hypothetical protein
MIVWWLYTTNYLGGFAVNPLRPRHVSVLQLCAIAILPFTVPAFAVSEAEKKSGVR